jgi:hypothetical protein
MRKFEREELDIKSKRGKEVEQFEASNLYRLLILPAVQALEGLKSAYDCKTLQELATLKGLRDGLGFTPKLMEQYKQEGKRSEELLLKLVDQENLENSRERDSTLLDTDV